MPAKQATPGAALPVALHPYTLAFTDDALEATYAANRFTATYMAYVLFLGALVVVVSLMVIVDSRFVEIFAPVTAWLTLLISARVWTHYFEDQKRARLMFGRMLLGLTGPTFICMVMLLRT